MDNLYIGTLEEKPADDSDKMKMEIDQFKVPGLSNCLFLISSSFYSSSVLLSCLFYPTQKLRVANFSPRREENSSSTPEETWNSRNGRYS